MDFVTTYHHAIDAILGATGMTDREAHINVGLVIYVAAQYLLRTRRASLAALIAVAGCELANESMDALFFGELRVADTIGDIVATMAWPTILFLISRHRRKRWARAEGPGTLVRPLAVAAASSSRHAIGTRRFVGPVRTV